MIQSNYTSITKAHDTFSLRRTFMEQRRSSATLYTEHYSRSQQSKQKSTTDDRLLDHVVLYTVHKTEQLLSYSTNNIRFYSVLS